MGDGSNMRILEDGTVEIKNKKTGATKIIQPDEVPNYGIPYSTYQKEKEAFDTVIGGGTKEDLEAQEAGKREKEDIITTIGKITGGKPQAISGMWQWTPRGTKAADTGAAFDTLMAALSLENRKKLKGTGTISDFEAKMLEKASTRLSRKMSEKEFVSTLKDLEAGLSGKPKEEDPKSLIDKYWGK